MVLCTSTHTSSAGAIVPTNRVAIGNPASILAANQYERILNIQEPMIFPVSVYCIDRSKADMVKITRRLSDGLTIQDADVK